MPICTDAVGLETDCYISEVTKRQCLAFAAALGETSESFLTTIETGAFLQCPR